MCVCVCVRVCGEYACELTAVAPMELCFEPRAAATIAAMRKRTEKTQ